MGWSLGNAVGMPIGVPSMSSVLGPIVSNYTSLSNPMPALPAYGSRPTGGYAPIATPVIPKSELNIKKDIGVNPGMITSSPAYKTTSPTQSQYYWGSQPYIATPADMGKLNNPALVGTYGWGTQPTTPTQNPLISKPAFSPATKYPSIPGYSAVNTTTRK